MASSFYACCLLAFDLPEVGSIVHLVSAACSAAWNESLAALRVAVAWGYVSVE
jgi:hypothetical protein